MRIGEVVAERFELQSLAGTGGMGAVYRAMDRKSAGVVALKSLHDPGGRHAERFLREAQVLATLNHPNIVRYVEHGRSATGELYMAMEWIEGQSLSQRIAATGGLSVAQTLDVGSQLASALGFAHARGIVHRDIKPSNVFVLVDTLMPKLLDFGIARLAQAARLTSNGMMLGTPGYMAPEQARGAATVNARADVFSLGCLIFKCLCGRPPFASDDARALIAQVLFEQAPRVSALRPDVPAALDALVARMLSKDPAARPADGAAVLGELRTITAGVAGASVQSHDLPEMLGGAELQWVCAVLASAPPAEAAASRTRLRATELQVPVVQFAAATPLEVRAVPGPALPEIGTVMEAAGVVPPELVAALRPLEAELDALADGSYLSILSDDDDPVALAHRALRCAQALHRARPNLRIAVSTGRALRAEGTGTGPALDRAASTLGSIAEGATGIALDALTLELLRGRVALEAGGGLRELDPLGAPTLPLRGRERELSRLLDFASRVRSLSEPRWSLLLADHGLGATRLLAEIRARVSTGAGLRVLAAACEPADSHVPFALVRRLLATAVAPEQLATIVQTRPDRPARLAAILAELARAEPLLLLIDDLDRADQESLALLGAALPAGAPLRVSVLATGRPGLARRLEPLGVSGELRMLEPLRPDVLALIAADLAPGVPTELARGLARGNPWILRALLDAPAEPIAEAALARYAPRLEPLGAQGRRILRALSIWGGEVPRGDLIALLGGPSADPGLDAQLDGLVRGGWLRRTGDVDAWGEASFEIVDPLVAAVAEAQLTDADRALGHRLAADQLEQRPGGEPARIARHWLLAGAPARATEHIRKSAGAALAAGRFAEAARLIEPAMGREVNPAVDASLTLIASEANLWSGRLARAAELAGSVRSSQLNAETAKLVRHRALAAAWLGDAAQLSAIADALLLLPLWTEANATLAAALASAALWDLGDGARAAELERRLPARPEDAREPLAAAARLHVDAARHERGGDWPRANAVRRAEAGLLARAGESGLGAWAQLHAISALVEGRVLEPAASLVAQLAAQVDREQLAPLAAWTSLANAKLLLAQGRAQEAEAHTAKAGRIAAEQGSWSLRGELALLEAASHLRAGRPREAEARATTALDLLRPLPLAHLRAQVCFAELRAAQGELAAALTLARLVVDRLDHLGAEAGAQELAVRRVAAEIFFRSGLRDLGRQQLARARDRIARELAAAEPSWRAGLERSPEVRGLAELAAAWLG